MRRKNFDAGQGWMGDWREEQEEEETEQEEAEREAQQYDREDAASRVIDALARDFEEQIEHGELNFEECSRQLDDLLDDILEDPELDKDAKVFLAGKVNRLYFRFFKSRPKEDIQSEPITGLSQQLRVLGLDSGVTFEEVKARFRELIAASHPDQNMHLDEAEIRRLTDETAAIISAYKAIKSAMGK